MTYVRAQSSVAGFTLLEVIVVLVITGLVSALLIQGLGGLLATRLTVANAIDNLDALVMTRNIVLEPLRGIIPDQKDGPNEFRGQPRTLKGRTLRSLQSTAGAPVPFKMTLEFDQDRGVTVLTYEEPGRTATELARWVGNMPEFKYRDLTGPWETNWPSPRSTTQIPWLIFVDTGETLVPLIAYVAGSHERVVRPQDLPFATGVPALAN